MLTENNPSKPKFEWHKIHADLRTKKGNKQAKISLRPSMRIRNKNGNDESLETKLHIDTEKSLQFQNDIGWNWHKSSNLPIISIKLQIKDPQKDVLLLPPQKLEAKIFAVKIIVNAFERDQIAYFEDIGIRGPSQIELRQGCGLFNGIRFMSTSYNNEGVKFYLLVVVYVGGQKGQIGDNVICSVLSPPIFVDSRKSARDYQQKRFLSFVQLFDPNQFQKEFTKRETKNSAQTHIPIENNFEGLYNYLTAPNIRHKVKHPLFLSVRFSKCFRIYYNSAHESFKDRKVILGQLIKKLQKRLVKEVGGEKRAKKNDDLKKKAFLISLSSVTSETKKSKIVDLLEYLDAKSIFIAEYEYMITDSFINIATLGDPVSAYYEIYPLLQRMSDRQISARKSKEVENSRSYEQNLSQKDDFSEQKFSVKKEFNEDDELNPSFRSQKHYGQKDLYFDSEQDNFSEDYLDYVRGRKKVKANLPPVWNQLSSYRENKKFLPLGMQKNLLQSNLVHPGGNPLNSSFNLITQIQENSLPPILQNPLFKGEPHSEELTPFKRPKIEKNQILEVNNTLKHEYQQHHIKSQQMQISTLRKKRKAMAEQLLASIDKRSSMLNQLLYQNQMLKARVMMELQHDENFLQDSLKSRQRSPVHQQTISTQGIQKESMSNKFSTCQKYSITANFREIRPTNNSKGPFMKMLAQNNLEEDLRCSAYSKSRECAIDNSEQSKLALEKNGMEYSGEIKKDQETGTLEKNKGEKLEGQLEIQQERLGKCEEYSKDGESLNLECNFVANVFHFQESKSQHQNENVPKIEAQQGNI